MVVLFVGYNKDKNHGQPIKFGKSTLQGISTRAAQAPLDKGGSSADAPNRLSSSRALQRPQIGGPPAPAKQPEARFGSTVHVTQHASRDPADLASKLIFYFEFWRKISSELRPFFTYK
ncbi:hypothetical protein LR48_Vigan07g145100 [Vigna angularis]|uniref:Uncharacterized protein n=1 Tax=Phaseolus angularis TaxID=3914 RepID=A0A0L9UYT2_PHAAN|nr:hypothetical protein LR48_Vigan07g145100 [Vigna angularis]